MAKTRPGFRGLTLLSVGVGGLAFGRMTVMNARTADVALKDLPSTIASARRLAPLDGLALTRWSI